MKTGTIVALGAALAAAAALSGAAVSWARDTLELPTGSYRTSCYQAHAYTGPSGGKVLTARCRTSSGGTFQSSLRYDGCRGDIANINGRLTCRSSPVPGAGVPSGSYQRSCWNARMAGGVLHATCRDRNGRPTPASIVVASCGARDITNVNGRLVCSGGASPGAGGSTLVLYGQPGYRGTSLVLRGATPSLAPWSFGDKAKSLQIRGRGRWEVCTLTEFRGRCVILGDSVYDLGSLRLANEISSARPVR